MTQFEWLNATNPARMLQVLFGRHEPRELANGDYLERHNLLTERQCALFALACSQRYRDSIDRHNSSHDNFSRAWLWASATTDIVPPDIRPELIREIAGDPFRPAISIASELLTWHDGIIAKMACAIYRSANWGDVALIHDALLDAGYSDEAVLLHLRGKETCPRCCGTGKVQTYPREQLLGSGPHYVCCVQCETSIYQHGRNWRLPSSIGCGYIPLRTSHVRGCWVIDYIVQTTLKPDYSRRILRGEVEPWS